MRSIYMNFRAPKAIADTLRRVAAKKGTTVTKVILAAIVRGFQFSGVDVREDS